MSEETEDWDAQATSRTGLPADVASAVLGHQRSIRGEGGLVYRFRIENVVNMSTLLEKIDQVLEAFAPKSRWETNIDVDESRLTNEFTHETLKRWCDADVTALYLGPE